MKLAITLAASVLLVAGCGASDPESGPAPQPSTPSAATSSEPSPDPAPEPAADAGAVVDISIRGGEVTPKGGRVEVEAGQEITLRITSDADEEIHVHSDPEHTYEVTAGESVTESFTIDTPGQVAVEAHHLDATIVQLVVRP
jgi:glucose/arabinose dehydrogenase|nr:hypothetical protein [Aeromicrobium sp.]